MITYVIIRLRNTQLDGGMYDTDRVQTVSHVLGTSRPGFTINSSSMSSGNHREKGIIVFPLSMEAAGVNRPQQFVVLIKQLTFSDNLSS